jgi:hypothetical protein
LISTGTLYTKDKRQLEALVQNIDSILFMPYLQQYVNTQSKSFGELSYFAAIAKTS